MNKQNLIKLQNQGTTCQDSFDLKAHTSIFISKERR